MCSLRSVYKTLTNSADPVGAVLRNNVSKQNAVRQIVDPAGIAKQNYIEGGSLTAKSVLDPGSVVSKSQAQIDALNYKAGQSERDRIAAEQEATTAANTKAALLKRRRNSSALATGAQGGGGSLSSVLAYGKSTFG